MNKRWIFFAILALATTANAEVFNTSHFVEPGQFAIGFEPVMTLSEGAGVAGVVKFTQGLNELNNLGIFVGNGDSGQKFRLGSNLTFDIFPDTKGQPGIGIAAQATYYSLAHAGELELLAIPYIHKSFMSSGGSEFEPYIAVPLGYGFSAGQYTGLATLSLGSQFKTSDHFSWVAELGVAINNSSTYIAGGIVYYH